LSSLNRTVYPKQQVKFLTGPQLAHYHSLVGVASQVVDGEEEAVWAICLKKLVENKGKVVVSRLSKRGSPYRPLLRDTAINKTHE
jgi:hypothetical protein